VDGRCARGATAGILEAVGAREPLPIAVDRVGGRVYLNRWPSSGFGVKACSLEKFTEEGAKPIDPPRYSRDRRLPLAL
jgi:hypothetical protein